MVNVPNALTVLRFALVPVIAWQLMQAAYDTACLLFIVSALSDLADGVIARRWNQRTRFGAVADPLADKLTMLSVTIMLAVQGALPVWFALAVVLRDVLIVGGALTFHFVIGHVEMAPSRLSKLNTALEFTLLLSVLALLAGFVPDGAWRSALLFATTLTIFLSGAHYVLAWGRKALRAGGAAARQS